jgi:hypothetical protein
MVLEPEMAVGSGCYHTQGVVVKWSSVSGALALAGMTCLVPAGAEAATVITWNMGETSGSTMYNSTRTHNGAITGDVTKGVTGHKGLAYKFTGDPAVVTIRSASVLNPGSGSFSVSLYFKSSTKPTSAVGDYDLVRKGVSTTSGGDWKMEVLGNGRAFCHFRGSRTVDVTGTTNVVNGSWNKITCSKSTSGVRVKVNGSIQASRSANPGAVSNTSSVYVGAKTSAEDVTTGSLDSLTVTKG